MKTGNSSFAKEFSSVSFYEKISSLLIFTLILTFISVSNGSAQASNQQLLVGIYPSSPFVFNDEQEPRGFSIDLWKAMAEELHLDYRFVSSTTINGALEDIIEDRVDVAVGALSITFMREQLIDFTHPYFHTGLGILVLKTPSWSVPRLARTVFSKKRALLFIGLLFFIILAGHIIWLVERHCTKGKGSFDKRYIHGVMEGMYWAIVTASTVGYGDKVAKSWSGRLLVVVLILCSLPVFACFTAQLASDITLREIRTGIAGPRDLMERRVGVLEGSTSQEYAKKLDSIVLSFDQINTAYEWLRKGHLDAVVYDRPSLLYYADTNSYKDVKVLEATFSPQDYGIALPEGSRLTEKLNRMLLRMIENGQINDIHNKWFGKIR